MDLALFDLDNTLIAGDSDFEWAQFLIGKGILDRDLYEAKNVEFYEQYKAGTLDIDVFLDFQLQPLSRYPRALLDTWQRAPTSAVASAYAGVRGVPALLPRAWFARFQAGGDQGARVWLRDDAQGVVTVTCEALAYDIDTPDDIRAS